MIRTVPMKYPFHSGPHWLNDRLIGFYFEFLHQRKFESSSRVCFISPEVSQFLKLASAVEIPVFLDPLHLEEKETVLMAVNNASGAQFNSRRKISRKKFDIRKTSFDF